MSKNPPPRPTDERPTHELVIEDLQERAAVGLEKYGTYLQPDNGRNSLQDAYEEVCDLQAYLKNEIRKRSFGHLFLVAFPHEHDGSVFMHGDNRNGGSPVDRGQALVFKSYSDAEKYAAKFPGATVYSASPAGGVRDRDAMAAADGLVRMLAHKDAELVLARDACTKTQALLAESEAELRAFRADFDAQIAQAVVTEKQRLDASAARLEEARDVQKRQALLAENEQLRQQARRLELALTEAQRGGAADTHLKVVAESRGASQLEAIGRVAQGHPCPEEGAFAYHPAVQHVDALWDRAHKAEERIARAKAELQRIAVVGGTVAASAALAALEGAGARG